MSTGPDEKSGIVPTGPALPSNLPAGARNFQAAVDGKLTPEVWAEILDAQIGKAKEGDRGAAKFLLEYAGGVASMRGATFVQQVHNHEHYHEAGPGGVTPRFTQDADRARVPGDVPSRTPEDYRRDRERVARRVAGGVGVAGANGTAL